MGRGRGEREREERRKEREGRVGGVRCANKIKR